MKKIIICVIIYIYSLSDIAAMEQVVSLSRHFTIKSHLFTGWLIMLINQGGSEAPLSFVFLWHHWAAVIITVLIGAVVSYFQLRRLKTRNVLLEKKVEERTVLLQKSRSLLVTELEERLEAEEVLRKTEFQFSRVWENSVDGMRITDKDGIIVKVNESFCRLVGRTKEELEGQPFAVIYQTLEFQKSMDLYKERFENRTVEEYYEREFTLWDGSKAWYEVSSSFLQVDDSTVLLLLIFRDVSERKKAENALKQYATELELLNRKLAESEMQLKKTNADKDRFFSVISHDLRSPFNSLLGFSDILVNDIETLTPVEIKNFAGSIYKSTRNLYNLLEDLLQWSRLQTGRIEHYPEELNLKRLCSGIINLLAGNALIKDITISNEIEHDITIYADEGMINSVIQNILSNAIKFSYSGGQIVFSAHSMDGKVEISISDEGIGIHEEDIDKLFSIESNFTTLGTASEKGTGLGLVISKEFIELNKGTISVSSMPGKGTTFNFTLPESKQAITAGFQA